MASGMGTGPGAGQGSWPSQPQLQPLQSGQPLDAGRQYPVPPYQGQPPQPAAPGLYSTGGSRFAVAEAFDGVNPDGTPRIVRAQLDPREVPALTMYLTQAPVVLAAPGNAQDELVPSAGQVIPRAFHSDGVWVWPAAVGYYLGCYQLPPSDALLAHIRMRNYQLGFVPQETRSAAAAELMAILNAPSAPAPEPQAASAPQVASAPSVPSVPQIPQNQPVPQNQPLIPPPLAPQAAVSGPILSAQTVAAQAAAAQSAPAQSAPAQSGYGYSSSGQSSSGQSGSGQSGSGQSSAPQLPSLPNPTVSPDPVPTPAPATMLVPMAEPAEAEAEATSPMTAEELAAALEASAVAAPALSVSGTESVTGSAFEPEPASESSSVELESAEVGAESGSSNVWLAESESVAAESIAAGSVAPESAESAAPVFEQAAQDDDDLSAPTVLRSTAGAGAAAATDPATDSAEPAKSVEPAPAESVDPNESTGTSGPTMVFSAAEAKAQWTSLDSSLPQAAPPLTPERFGPEFGAAGNKHAAWVSEQLEAFTAYMPTGDWSVDHNTRSYTQSDRSLVVDGLGTLSPEGIWTWAWSDFSGWDQDSGILDQSRLLRELAEQAGIAELTAGSVDLTGVGDAEDPATAAEMLAWTAMGLLGARGYIGHSSSNGGRIYYLVTDPSVPRAEPSLVQIPRHLFEGTATFGENATECVIGYAEHHGWEWNRTPIGIGVAATGVGSFAIEVADDKLVGLSLHI